MTKLDNALFSCEQIRLFEQQAIELYGFDELTLMLQAGMDAFSFIHKNHPDTRHLAVFCGKGNNAGDGYVLARLAYEQGLSVIVYQCNPLDDLTIAARHMAMKAMEAGVEFQSADEPIDCEVELIVDALLGIGLKGAVHGSIAAAISQINSSGLPIVSLDLPSGLNADTGQADSFCVQAQATLTFLGLKPGLFTWDGPDHCGKLECFRLQMEQCLANTHPYASLLNYDSLPLQKRKKNSHKGQYGHVLIIGGGPGMPGAVCLAAKAALRSGAGVVTVATYPSHVNAVLPFLPEAMVSGVNTAKDLDFLLNRATICVIGPGLGESEWAQALFLAAITSQLPMVIDASALHLLAKNPQMDDNWVLTPHPGEAAALLECSTKEIQLNRFDAAEAIQNQYGGVVVLKGIGTIVQSIEKERFVCSKGNPGMACAGMGDALSGIIASLCAQGLSLSESAKLGVWVHGSAGDKIATTKGEIGILSSDLIEWIPVILNDLRTI